MQQRSFWTTLILLAGLTPPVGATDSQQAPFNVGDRVVIQAVAVMEISGIGPHSSFVKEDREAVESNVGGAVLRAENPLKTVLPNQTLVYALRFLDETDPFLLVPVAAAKQKGLRRALTQTEATALLSRLAKVKDPIPPLASEFDLAMENAEGTDPWRHLLLLRKLIGNEKNPKFTTDHQKLLERVTTFIVDEFSLALSANKTSFEQDLRSQVTKTLAVRR